MSTSKAGASRKRGASASDDARPASGEPSKKVQKVHPFFAKASEKPPGAFQWLKPLGPKGSCWHATNLTPTAAPRVAAFDLDGTVIKSSFGKGVSKAKAKGPAASANFEWWNPVVPKKLEEVYNEGYAILLITNQALKPGPLRTWKEKMNAVALALPKVPFRLFAATEKDNYRKPMRGMWTELERIYAVEGVTINKDESFYVGDAAGRVYGKDKPADFAGTDRKWADNVGLTFYTPEEYFLKLPKHTNVVLEGFRASSVPELPEVTPTSTPIVPDPARQEIVIFHGYPCLGKSTFYHRHFEPAGYVHINQDTLGTRPKCIKAVQEALKEGKSCVVDNTNRNAATRAHYIELAKKAKIPLRCFWFTGSKELAWHNNLYRAYNLPPSVAAKEPARPIVPYIGFAGFKSESEEPTLNEGFEEIKKVNWVFHGSDEERKYWEMWLQIDGK
ncbi:PNK3P-domain-containing protein [Schizophyllum commune H4-8]|uniref:PNK3P-domain-containing protein n=1 Tax=Schizophyllum commune (strain H4-8 / FGSC 9210) TaxID=578458 RepID=UPI00215E9316|nr:PNK3P-domain-containing protein [Schizophyllum commune H4-8]KAI5900063.1 PNK3P-domain-containing protein [Schizophyllum commune H4-8]